MVVKDTSVIWGILINALKREDYDQVRTFIRKNPNFDLEVYLQEIRDKDLELWMQNGHNFLTGETGSS